MGVVVGGIGWHAAAGSDHAITISPTVARSRGILFGKHFSPRFLVGFRKPFNFISNLYRKVCFRKSNKESVCQEKPQRKSGFGKATKKLLPAGPKAWEWEPELPPSGETKKQAGHQCPQHVIWETKKQAC